MLLFYKAFILFRIAQFVIVALAPEPFDTSSLILVAEYMEGKVPHYPTFMITILNKLMAWDSVYFLKLAISGISYEHEWVFGPLWWRFLSLITSIMPNPDIYDVLLVSIIINNLCLIASAYMINQLARTILKNQFVKSFVGPKFPEYASLLIIIQPSGIFSLIGYSESSSQLLCYTALLLRQKSLGTTRIRNKHLYEISGFLFALAYGLRSNCLLYGIVYIYDMIKFPYYRSKLTALFTGLLLFFSLIFSIYVPYQEYCPDRGEWCHSLTKSLTSYAQNHYWGVGFLKYYTSNNIPNFLFAMPQIFVLFLSLCVFSNWSVIRGEWLVGVIYLIIQIFWMHIQVINRVSTFLPLHILYVAYLLSINRSLGKAISAWWTFWVLLQTGLFACFLPPA